MNAILEELGRPLTTKEAAEIIGIDHRQAVKLYAQLGGVRIGKRQIIFYERRIVDAISKLQQEQREVSVARSSNNDHAGRKKEAAAQTVPNKKGSPEVGGGRKGQNGIRSGSVTNDPHGVLA